MAITLVNPATWAFGAKLTSAQANALDANVVKALDKTAAGDTLSGAVVLAATGSVNAAANGANVRATVAGALIAVSGGGRYGDLSAPFEVTPSGNAVTLEDQMMKVSGNDMDYQAVTTLYTRSMRLLKIAIGR